MKSLTLLVLIIISTLCFSNEFHDLRGRIDNNNDVHLYYREVRYTGDEWSTMHCYSDLIDFDVTSMQINTMLESHSYSSPDIGYSAGDIFYDYTLFDEEGLSTINCGKFYSHTSNYIDSTFIRQNIENLAIWDNYWGFANIKRSNFNSGVIYATYKSGYDSYRIIKSNDEGAIWSLIEEGPNYLLRGVSPFDDQLLFYASNDGFLYRSNDGSNSEIIVDNNVQLNWFYYKYHTSRCYVAHLDFKFDQDGLHIFAVVKDSSTNTFHLIRSSDNGLNWEIISNEASAIFIDVDLTNSGLIYKAVSTNIYKSTDYGETFTLFQNLPENIKGLYQPDNSENLYTITDLILYEVTYDSILPLIIYTSIDDENLSPVCSIKINNYPNPFNPTTTFEFSIQNNSNVELSIFNVKGQKIKTLVQNEFTKGYHSVVWNGDDDFGNSVASGVYLYKLSVNGKTKDVKKCILLK